MYKTESAEQISGFIFDQFEDGHTNDYNERCSDYFSVVTDTETEYAICISVTEETNGIPEADRFFSIHIIDDIHNLDCDIITTDDIRKETLVKAIEEIITNCI